MRDFEAWEIPADIRDYFEEVVGGELVAHPSQSVKPLSVIRWLVDLVAVPGMTVLDPFAGSGPVAEACTAAGVSSISVELDGRFVPLIVQRLERVRQGVAA